MISPTVDRFANRDLMELVIQDYATKKIVENLDYANVVTNELTGEAQFAYGGRQHPKRVTFYGEKGGTVKVETQLKTMRLYQLALGAENKDTMKFMKREVLTATGSSSITFTTKNAPIEGTINIYPVNDDCGTEVSSSFTVADKTITVGTPDASKYKAGTDYVVYYLTNLTNAQVLSITTNSFPKEVAMYGTTFEKTESGKILEYLMNVYKAAPQPTFSFNWANNGEPATVIITFDLLADGSGNFVDYALIEQD